MMESVGFAVYIIVALAVIRFTYARFTRSDLSKNILGQNTGNKVVATIVGLWWPVILAAAICAIVPVSIWFFFKKVMFREIKEQRIIRQKEEDKKANDERQKQYILALMTLAQEAPEMLSDEDKELVLKELTTGKPGHYGNSRQKAIAKKIYAGLGVEPPKKETKLDPELFPRSSRIVTPYYPKKIPLGYRVYQDEEVDCTKLPDQ